MARAHTQSTMVFLLSLFSLLALSHAAVYDCTINKYTDIEPVLRACSVISVGKLQVPADQTLTWDVSQKSLTFKGEMSFEAKFDDSAPLLTLTGNHFMVTATESSLINGQGLEYWDGQGVLSEKKKPVLIRLQGLGNGTVQNLNILNCPQTCVEVRESADILVTGLNINVSAAATHALGVDTHGITIINSTRLSIEHTNVNSLGDCISVNQATSTAITNMTCSGTLGLTVRPVWESANVIKDISFKNCTVISGYTGIRVVTSPNQAEGEIYDVNFEDIYVKDILNVGIEIRQDLQDVGHPKGNVNITLLNIKNVRGTMTDRYVRAVYINCGNGSCSDWYWSNINIEKAQVENECNFEPDGFNCW